MGHTTTTHRRMHALRRTLAITLAALALVGACGDDDAARTDAGSDSSTGPEDGAPSDGASDDAGRDSMVPPRRDAGSDAGTAPLLDPALFDCTSLGPTGDRLPERASPIPVACGLDPTCRTHQVSAHRGAGGQLGHIAPEDTLAAYRAGIVLGVEYVETDPRPTSDGVLVNIHDPDVDRTTDGTGAVDAMTFEEIRALRIRTTIAGDYSCERVPTLTEILETCRGRVVVLVDANKTDRVDLLVASILEADALEWAVFDTSSVDKIDRALAMEPGLQFMIRPDSIAAIGEQLDHFAPRVPTIVELDDSELTMDGAAIVHARGSRVLIDVFGGDLEYDVMGTTSSYEDRLGLGADILQTDRPDGVIDLLRRLGER